MKASLLSHLIDPLREFLGQYELVIGGWRERHGISVVGLACDLVPPEILAAAGTMPLRVPASADEGGAGCCCGAAPRCFDALVAASTCTLSWTAERIDVPPRWGEEAALAYHAALGDLMGRMGLVAPGAIDQARLAAAAGEYNALRRVVRGIAALRRDKPALLSQADLMALFSAAVSLPPSMVMEHCAVILDAMNTTAAPPATGIPAMVYAGALSDPALLDEIEEAGILIVEDDLCSGRRQFDMSYNAASPHLYAEILDAWSYRPRCPALREGAERYELLYRLAKGHGIEMVVLVEDGGCAARRAAIGELRVRLMRGGIDPLVVRRGDAAALVRDYVARAGA